MVSKLLNLPSVRMRYDHGLSFDTEPCFVVKAAMAFLMSFENFNTTVMLTGSNTPLTVALFNRLREGSTPVLNAVALVLMVDSALLALLVMGRSSR
ncbi:hypothetical protein [Marinobacter sp. es.048]|uniref:hypothetical protein n=1 Tax=Marinobacter sp. es.048 TaxID=1761795 RepID=UPI001E4E60C1|nr:hypothetical protein [Marinobacter sp. es.048]